MPTGLADTFKVGEHPALLSMSIKQALVMHHWTDCLDLLTERNVAIVIQIVNVLITMALLRFFPTEMKVLKH